jgi:hypothetical protein
VTAQLTDVATGYQLWSGYEERTHWMALLKVDPRLDPPRSESRFEQLLRAMRLT